MGEMADFYDHIRDEPDPISPWAPCPEAEWGECNGRMVARMNKRTGELFVGCSNFPRCRQSAPIADGGSRR